MAAGWGFLHRGRGACQLAGENGQHWDGPYPKRKTVAESGWGLGLAGGKRGFESSVVGWHCEAAAVGSGSESYGAGWCSESPGAGPGCESPGAGPGSESPGVG